MIYLGTGGIPISAKGGSSISGVRRIAELGLNAMEVEFVRGVNMKESAAKELGEVAKELGVRLSVHAPYYINLASDKVSVVKASKQRIFESASRAEDMGADSVAIHAAYYGRYPPEDVQDNIYTMLADILDRMRQDGIKNTFLGVETMAKQSQWGTFDETLAMHKKDKRIIPYIDWCHIWVRNNGAIDYGLILDKLEKSGINHVNSHFSCSKFNDKLKSWQDVHVAMSSNSMPRFEPLAKELVGRKIDVTIISESPILEEDSLKMKNILKNYGYKWPEK